MSSINYLTQIHIEHGALRHLKTECARLEIDNPLFISKGILYPGLLSIKP